MSEAGEIVANQRGVSTDCRTPEGVAVGLIDGIIAIARVLCSVEPTQAVREALADLRQDEYIRSLLATGTTQSGTCHLIGCLGKGVHEPHGIGTPTPSKLDPMEES